MTEQRTRSRPAVSHERGQLKRLEIMSIVEAATLVTLVCVTVPLKHLFDWPTGSRIMGPLHGIAFLAYVWTVLQTVAGGGWQRCEIARLLIVAFLPFAGFFNIGWLRRRSEILEGQAER